MKLKNRPVAFNGAHGKIHILRNGHGIPEITAASIADLMQGLGWVHANDRQLQTLLTRILLQGRGAELIKADEALIGIDTYMRRMNFMPDAQAQKARLDPGTRKILEAYVKGFNDWLDANGPVFEFRMLGYHRPEPYRVKDCFLISKAMSFLGLAEIQAKMEKFLVQLIQHEVSEDKIRELFPYLRDPINTALIRQIKLPQPIVPEAVKWLDMLPRFRASNNWAISGQHTRSGFPIFCNDPHLEVNRLPNVCQEVVLRLPGDNLMGMTVPGIPALITGRNSHLSWGPTYSYMDMMDYRIEQCRDGNYYRNEGWRSFTVRKEEIKVKKKPSIHIKVYENGNGLLEGDPYKAGYYLTLGWSAANNCVSEDFNSMIAIMSTHTVEEAMPLFRKMEAVSMNWVMADTEGNIGYQMSGRHFKRPERISGLLPRAGWDRQADPVGFNDPEDLPKVFNPAEGFIATANHDLNGLGRSRPINLSMAPYRSDRIKQLLMSRDKLDVAFMKDMQYDLYSQQAERLMKHIVPLLPDTTNGRILKSWDRCYHADSKGATLFESVYRAIIDAVFGDNGMGRDVVDHVISKTALFNGYFGNLDAILEMPASAWFENQSKKVLFRKAIAIGLDVKAVPYKKTRAIMLTHLLFDGRLPKFFGLDYGPINLPGSRATIVQGQLFHNAGRLTSFSPIYHFIADLATGESHTNLAGGPSDRPYSKWYVCDLKNWYEGNYKALK